MNYQEQYQLNCEELHEAYEDDLYYRIDDMTEEQLEDYLNRDEPHPSSIICPHCGSEVSYDEPCWQCIELAEIEYQEQSERSWYWEE